MHGSLTLRGAVAGLALVGVVVSGGLTYNQYLQQKEINQKPNTVQIIKEVIVTATPQPTATPTAKLRFIPVVTKPVSTVK